MNLYNYILTNVRKNKFIFNKEDMEDTLKLYEEAKKINKGKKKYNDIFIYDIEIPDGFRCVLDKEELETLVNRKSVFVFLEGGYYQKIYLTAEDTITRNGDKILVLKDENNAEAEYNYYVNNKILIDLKSNESREALRVSKDDIRNLKNKILSFTDKFILQYENERVLIVYKRSIFSFKSKIRSYVIEESMVYILSFIENLCSEKQEIRKNAESKLEQLTNSVEIRFYRMVYLMAGVKKDLIINTKNLGYEYLLRGTGKKSLLNIPKKLLEEHEDILQKGIAILLLYNIEKIVDLENLIWVTRNQRMRYEIFKEKLSNFNNEYKKCVEEYFGENSRMYIDILNSFTEVIYDEFRISEGFMPIYNTSEFNEIKSIFKKIKYNLNELEKYLKENDCESYDYFDYEESDNYIK